VSFTWAATKDGLVRISWEGKVVTTLAGERATRFLDQVEDADEDAEQLLLARVTGNFKRGNERSRRGS
jgi:hypothetical protein